MRSAGLRELVLGGFEVFSELARVPIRPLTLLYGPNSAGKSAIEEALTLLCEMCTIPEYRGTPSSVPFDTFTSSLAERVKKAWRRESDDPMKHAARMTLGASVDLAAEDDDDQRGPMPHVLEFLAGGCTLSITFRLRREVDALYESMMAHFRSADDYDLGQVFRDVELAVNGVAVLDIVHGQSIGVNFGHAILQTAGVPEECRREADSGAGDVIVDGDWAWLRGEWIRLDANKRLVLLREEEFHDDRPARSELTAAIEVFLWAVNSLLPICCNKLRDGLEARAVPASRQVPTAADLNFLVARSALGQDHPDFDIRLAGDQQYASLAASFVETLGALAPPAGGYAHRVNRMLTDHLFMERGYHLRMDYRVVLTPTQFEALRDSPQEAPAPSQFTLLVRLFLADAQSRQYAFTEVGSGLGYVLPALCASCDPGARVVLLQQPELHLHPAMQAALGDVFIETSRLHEATLIETHSEHLLLRVLKRMRQAVSNKTTSELSLASDDLCVLYFAPNVDGTTTVRRLRVTDDGEFLDRWPRGFFAERDQELWDD